MKQVFLIQQKSPQKNDFFLQVKSDLYQLNLKLSDEEIKNMSKLCFRDTVEARIKIECIKYLSGLIKRHTKTKKLSISNEMQQYLKDDSLSCKQQILLFNLRVRSADIKTNYRNKFKNNMNCRYKCGLEKEEDMGHLLRCSSLITNDVLKYEASQVDANHIYGSYDQQIKVISVYEKIFRRIEIMKLRG